MIQSAMGSYLFRLGRPAYGRARLLGWLWFIGFVVLAATAFWLSIRLLSTYTFTFTYHLRWQDALIALLWFVTLLCLGGAIFSIRYQVALRAGYKHEMLTIVEGKTVMIRDLSPENLLSLFWMIHASFWCFIVVLIGLTPEMVLGWTLHLPSWQLVFVATGAAILLSIAGLVLSVTFAWFIIMGVIGSISLFSKLGECYTYKLDNRTTLRVDDDVLTIIYPGAPEAMLDLNALYPEDKQQLLMLLQTYILDMKENADVNESEQHLPLYEEYVPLALR